MLDQFTNHVSNSATTYGIVFAVVVIDAILPIVPSETVVIAAAVLAANGNLVVWFILAAAAAAAILGDNISYLVGAKVGQPIVRRFFRGKRSKETLGWAQDQLRRRGGIVIVAARFIPGGRTATTLGSGLLHFPWVGQSARGQASGAGKWLRAFPRGFLAFDAIGGVLWACEVTAIGYFGGQAFGGTWKSLVLAFGIAAALTVLIEVGRRLWNRLHAA